MKLLSLLFFRGWEKKGRDNIYINDISHNTSLLTFKFPWDNIFINEIAFFYN